MSVDARDIAVSGNPGADEVAAIIAAVEALWPRPAADGTVVASRESAWRFSGRWWAPHELTRRPRPRR